jgi:AraC-like DNA-binding protein
MRFFQEQIINHEQLFVLKEERFPYNDFPLHIHAEYELIVAISGQGERYVGDCIAPFSSGDLCFFGPNLPHTFYNKHLPSNREVHQIVIQFKDDFLGRDFFDKPQFLAIRELFRRSLQGVSFTGAAREIVQEKMKQMLLADEAEAAASLLSVLNILARTEAYELLSDRVLPYPHIEKDTERISSIYHYLLDNFKREISLREMANVAHLSTAAFCRYFKKHTRKTLSQFVNELRISYACKLLQQNELSVLQICYESGFNNISHFNRQFRQLTKQTPLRYKKNTKQVFI